eukprot:CAMPEP_0174284424 /NCGR_PEP_ID=MMETSP0809-20121228/5450_1 /TAXON_ID=73025 ORGANISM="Eutreptiella gymnastica-like, Strain CCMP1594" /NCGR_SAMPLE_ID=MMETSP0809 /ASSEMBLY_ACC=CAM_ASM_000658 /LENGTH=57 /DNA_ID=CAMNT_0015379921 /DNA_START=41 /DNA_END=210 /DNA_ORIENTATION=-
MNPPSPQIATHAFSGNTSLAAMAQGKPAPIVARALSNSSVFDWRVLYCRANQILYMP